MFTEQHTMSSLFGQLGLDSSEQDIEHFIDQHKGLNKTQYLHDAPFWSPAQSQFLKDAIEEDAAWAEVIDQLNLRLHE
ncbi:DUF2789 domain-containing protein [Alteromonas sp. D210916BOD_24]|uniref:DUF2789 domain-containing protein n=1 Tax=Alteromonas sp. D210916BOD_24 TaxID=3157618 RepID=UPI00399C7C52